MSGTIRKWVETGYDRNKHMFTKVTLDQQNKLSGYHPLHYYGNNVGNRVENSRLIQCKQGTLRL